MRIFGRAKHDRWAEPAESSRILELGCGKRKRYSSSIGLDVLPHSLADVVHDLDEYPYPFDDDSFDCVVCDHVLEHVRDVIRTVEEAHRLLVPGGLLRVEVPHFSSVAAYTDPTHRHFFSSSSFDYFIEGTQLCAYGYTEVRYEMRGRLLTLYKRELMPAFFERWINRHLGFYERHFAFVLTGNLLRFELKAVK